MWEKLPLLSKMNPILSGFGSFVKSLTSKWILSLEQFQNNGRFITSFRPISVLLVISLAVILLKTKQNQKAEKREVQIADLNARNKILVQAFASSKKREYALQDSIIQLQCQYVQEITTIDAIPIPQLQRSVDSVVGKYFNRYYIGEFETAKPKY
jgi:hypothetical protein